MQSNTQTYKMLKYDSMEYWMKSHHAATMDQIVLDLADYLKEMEWFVDTTVVSTECS